MAQVRAKKAILGQLLGGFERILGVVFGALLQMHWKAKNTEKPLVFTSFRAFWGCLDGMVGPSWRACWAMLTPRWHILIDVGATLRHVGRKIASKSAKMSFQHV